MTLLNCPQCNGKLTLNETEHVLICEYCGAKFLLEKTEKQQMLDEIILLKKVGDFEKAEKKFKKLLKKYPVDYDVLWKYVLFETNDLSQQQAIYLDEQIAKIQECALKAIELAPDNVAEVFEKKWNAFAEDYIRKQEISNKRLEQERLQRLQEVINGDYTKLDGVYLGIHSTNSSQFLCESGLLYLRVYVKTNCYLIQKSSGNDVFTKKIHVKLDNDAYFREVYTKRKFLKKEVLSRPLVIDNQKLQLLDVMEMDSSFGNEKLWCQFKHGDRKIIYFQ